VLLTHYSCFRDPLHYKLCPISNPKSSTWQIMSVDRHGWHLHSFVSILKSWRRMKMSRTVSVCFISRCLYLRTFFYFSQIDTFTEEDKERYRDPDYYIKYRRSLENELNVI
jgi:hypothetical protein